MPAPLAVLFVTSEAAPWSKTGGLGDVSAALPAALAKLDCDMRVMLPAYRGMQGIGTTPVAQIPARGSIPPCRIGLAVLPSGVRLLLVESPALYDRAGGPYQDEGGKDWPDNALRFGCLSHAAAWVAAHGLAEGWRPQILHAHDWQAGLAPAYLRFLFSAARVPTVFTIHNLAFQGVFPPSTVADLGLPPASLSMEGLEYYGQMSFLKGALQYAQAITTVSPTYSREIQSAELGFGMDGLLSSRSNELHGIVNGIDVNEWNPAKDPHIAARYDADRLALKPGNKTALQRRMNLPKDEGIPLFAAISRMTSQKGTDLVAALGERIAAMPAQLVLLGSGDAALEKQCVDLAAAHPRSVAVRIGFDEKLAHLIEAGADFFLMPSRFEPCGLNQMYSQRYGTPPIARATGGLADTITDHTAATAAAGRATGFLFKTASAEDLYGAVRRAASAYQQPAQYRRLQEAGMARDFSWAASALRYRDLYDQLSAAALASRT
jgi:starch synthase